MSLLLVAMPFAPSSVLFLVVRPGATIGVLAPSSVGSVLVTVEVDYEAVVKGLEKSVNPKTFCTPAGSVLLTWTLPSVRSTIRSLVLSI